MEIAAVLDFGLTGHLKAAAAGDVYAAAVNLLGRAFGGAAADDRLAQHPERAVSANAAATFAASTVMDDRGSTHVKNSSHRAGIHAASTIGDNAPAMLPPVIVN